LKKPITKKGLVEWFKWWSAYLANVRPCVQTQVPSNINVYKYKLTVRPKKVRPQGPSPAQPHPRVRIIFNFALITWNIFLKIKFSKA
jgi:hypothetical protein